MPKLLMLSGLSGSGKSTWAKEYLKSNPRARRVNRDDLRSMTQHKWSPKNERVIQKVEETLIRFYVAEGFDVVIDNTHTHPSHKLRLSALAKELGCTLEGKSFLDVPFEECVKRDLARPNSVGKDVILKQWLSVYGGQNVSFDNKLPTCLIFDLDGTVCDISHRNPYDASTCEQDEPRWHVINMIHGLVEEDHIDHVFAFSGREDTYRLQTESWLDGTVQYDELHMRKAGDHRKDAVIKKELYEEHIKGKYNVAAVFDDRPVCIRLWRSLGLPVVNVSESIGMEF